MMSQGKVQPNSHKNATGIGPGLLSTSDLTQVAMRDPLLFGDYRTALTPEQPRVYEDIQDYDAAKGLFEEVSMYAPNCSDGT